MRRCLTILRYEYRMQMARIATWGIFCVAIAMALFDNFPSASNLARLEFLGDPVYFIYRTVSLGGLVLVFGTMFLLSSRIPLDQKTGVKSLFMAGPLKKGEYVLGKLFAGFLYVFSLFSIFLLVNVLVYIAAAPFEVKVMDLLAAFLKTLGLLILPVSVFMGLVSVALPAVMDIRLFYLLISILFILNAATVGSAGQMPFFLITSGDLVKLIWQHPRWPFTNAGSIQANLIFLLGCGLLSWALVLLKRNFWRAE